MHVKHALFIDESARGFDVERRVAPDGDIVNEFGVFVLQGGTEIDLYVGKALCYDLFVSLLVGVGKHLDQVCLFQEFQMERSGADGEIERLRQSQNAVTVFPQKAQHFTPDGGVERRCKPVKLQFIVQIIGCRCFHVTII